MVVTNNALKYADILFESDWYKMSNEYQKYFIIMIAETQRPIYLDGYGIIRVSLEAFTRVWIASILSSKYFNNFFFLFRFCVQCAVII